jgi:DNA replication protein DnaC
MATITAATAANDAAAAYQRLRGHLAYLGLKAATDALPGLLDEARDGRVSMLDALERLMGAEAAAAESRKLASRLHWAALPAPWRLEDYDFAAQPGADEAVIRELATLRFIDEAANVLFVGPPGTGKTMLSAGLARAAAEAGHKVLFTSCEDLVRRLRRAIAEHRSASGLRFFTSPRLLVIDLCRHRNYAEPQRVNVFIPQETGALLSA